MAKPVTEVLLTVAACPVFVEVFHISVLTLLVLISLTGLFNTSNAHATEQQPEDL